MSRRCSLPLPLALPLPLPLALAFPLTLAPPLALSLALTLMDKQAMAAVIDVVASEAKKEAAREVEEEGLNLILEEP